MQRYCGPFHVRRVGSMPAKFPPSQAFRKRLGDSNLDTLNDSNDDLQITRRTTRKEAHSHSMNENEKHAPMFSCG